MSDVDRKRQLSFAIFWAMWQRGITPPKLAKIINRSPDAVRSWRDGDHVPNALDLAPLAAALRVSVEYFTDPPEIPAYPFEDYDLNEQPERWQARRSGQGTATPTAADAAALALEEMGSEAEARPDVAAQPPAGRRKR